MNVNKTLNHPVFGPLTRTCTAVTNCDWKGTICLPGFSDCYQRWNWEGTEAIVHSGNRDQSQGVFPLLVSTGQFDLHAPEEYFEPYDSQVAAYRILTERHDQLATTLSEQLVAYIDDCGREQFLVLEDDVFERLSKRDRILGTLSLNQVILFSRSRGGIAYAGFSFSTDVWDSEHGLGTVALGTQFLGIGGADAADEQIWPPHPLDDRR